MNTVFADTSYFIAMLNPKDKHHERAMKKTRERQGTLVTTTWVLTELANFLVNGTDRQLFMETLQALEGDPSTMILPADQTLFDRGVELFSDRPDKTWSLTDYISFTVMTEMRIRDALSTDHHFEQAGFRALLRDELPA